MLSKGSLCFGRAEVLNDIFYPGNNRKNQRAAEPMQQEMFDFVEFMHSKAARQALPSKHEPALLSEQTLEVDWNWHQEDNAWRSFH